MTPLLPFRGYSSRHSDFLNWTRSQTYYQYYLCNVTHETDPLHSYHIHSYIMVSLLCSDVQCGLLQCMAGTFLLDKLPVIPFTLTIGGSVICRYILYAQSLITYTILQYPRLHLKGVPSNSLPPPPPPSDGIARFNHCHLNQTFT